MGNKADKSKSVDEEDDGDSEDKKLLLSIMSGFKEQSTIITSLFNYLDKVFSLDKEIPNAVVEYSDLSQMLERGIILCENQFLREVMGKRIKDIVLLLHSRSAGQGSSKPGDLSRQNSCQLSF